MIDIDEKAYCCALNRIFGFEPKVGLALINGLGSAKEVFMLDRKELEHILGTHSKHKDSINLRKVEETAEELDRLNRQGITFIGYGEPDYPELLKECDDPPVGLYVRSVSSHKEVFNTGTALSIVGTRDISPYGKEWCGRIVEGLAACRERPCIVSGLAIGTDINAHLAALEAGLPTIAVMATGPETVYPFRHRSIAERMAATPGCALITDYPPGTAALPVNFLRRNRIIAGLSLATILIESKVRGGGMMTARLAHTYNREVYVLPGRADDLRSQGCNILIREKTAEPITDLESFIQSIRLTPERELSRQGISKENLDRLYNGRLPQDRISQMSEILLSIRSERGIMLEDLANRIKTDYRRTAELVGILESDGLIETDLLQRCFIRQKR